MTRLFKLPVAIACSLLAVGPLGTELKSTEVRDFLFRQQ
jgi:hypothetical protein